MASKRAAKRQKGAPAPEVQVETLLARCDRGDLELLLAHHVRGGSVPLDDVLALLPDAKRGLRLPKPEPVKQGAARTGTGLFDAVDDEILVDILGRLDLKTRLKCVMTVCKAWRGLRDAKELWTSLTVTPWILPNGMHLDGQGMLRLLAWLPDLTAVTTFDVHSGWVKKNLIAPDAIKKALCMLPNLTSLELDGKKITPAVLTTVATKCSAMAAQITNLNVNCDDVRAAEALLCAMPRLRKLTIPVGNSIEVLLDKHAASVRCGGTILLAHLDLSGCSGTACLSWASLGRLGAKLPELETLVTGIMWNVRNEMIGRVSREVPYSVSPFARLRRLHINKMCGSVYWKVMNPAHPAAANDKCLPAEEMGAVLRGLFAACPSLEHLHLDYGYVTAGGYPGTDGAFNELPATLRSLATYRITVTLNDFATCHLPLLRSLDIFTGGREAGVVEDFLVKSCPELKRARSNSCRGAGGNIMNR